MDRNNRMLIRSRVLLTDMHDGRKKTFLPLTSTSDKVLLKVGVGLRQGGGLTEESKASALHFEVSKPKSKDHSSVGVYKPDEHD